MLMIPIVIMTMPEGKDRDYMEQLYVQYHRLMLATAWKYNRDPVAVEDIVSDSCVSLMKSLSVLQALNENSLKRYIVTTVKNTALNYFKKRNTVLKYVTDVDVEAVAAVADRSDWECEIALRQELDAVWMAINQLPEKEREIMRMKYGLEMSDAAIAEQVGLSAKSIAKYISRARAKIKSKIYAE